jgi:hypothetical protein
MKWVTRERPGVDHNACPWLIRRFVDGDAEFFYVPADEVLSVAERGAAMPYDVPRLVLLDGAGGSLRHCVVAGPNNRVGERSRMFPLPRERVRVRALPSFSGLREPRGRPPAPRLPAAGSPDW